MCKNPVISLKLITAALLAACAALPVAAAPTAPTTQTAGSTVVVSLSGDHPVDGQAITGLGQLNAPPRQVLFSTQSDTDGPLTPHELSLHASQARALTGAQVSPAKRWDFWLAHPELVEASDFIAATIFPAEHDVSASYAVEFAVERWVLLREAYPNKRIVVVATDWPEQGDGAARADYRSGFGVWAKALDIEYYWGALPHAALSAAQP